MIKLFTFLLTILPDKDEEPDRWFDGEALEFSTEMFLFLLGFTIVLFIMGFFVKKLLVKYNRLR